MSWQRIWNDPVWSKVIASVITGAPFVLWALIPKNPISLTSLAVVLLVGGALLMRAYL